ncbi:hypothetical protein F4810DRAFT_415468 [Camillea tinctor]|nr:hypothetical protein F4810DRAFT_415468 [Camillea tinctor]
MGSMDKYSLGWLFKKTFNTARHHRDGFLIKGKLCNNLIKNINGGVYLPPTAISEILDNNTIIKALPGVSEKTIDIIHKDYVIVFAVLSMGAKAHRITRFIGNVCDDDLPLQPVEKRSRITNFFRNGDQNPIKLFQKWTKAELEGFYRWQWAFKVPTFDLIDAAGRAAPHYDFDTATVLPLLRPEGGLSETFNEEDMGTFGEVSCVGNDPRCHEFYPMLNKLGITTKKFALKILNGKIFKNEKPFQHEVEQLHRFNGRINSHIITLLATFTFRGDMHFVFPWAECNLTTFWDFHPLERNVDFIRWISDPLHGLVCALWTIHEPQALG